MGRVSYTSVYGMTLSENRNGVQSEYVSDVIGSTISLLNSSQAETDTFSYWPFGEQASRTGTSSTNLQWLGARSVYTDSSTRTWNSRRSYSRTEGRWQQPDALRRDRTRYSYAFDSPVTFRDTNGFMAQAVVAAPPLVEGLSGLLGEGVAGLRTGVLIGGAFGVGVMIGIGANNLGAGLGGAVGGLWPTSLPAPGQDEWCAGYAAIGRPCPPLPPILGGPPRPAPVPGPICTPPGNVLPFPVTGPPLTLPMDYPTALGLVTVVTELGDIDPNLNNHCKDRCSDWCGNEGFVFTFLTCFDKCHFACVFGDTGSEWYAWN